jgi:2-dehydropantoate 2-reductase
VEVALILGEGFMHFLIVGAGAMGCLFAARLKKAGFEVLLYEKIRERVQVIREKGITVEGFTREQGVRVPAWSEKPPGEPDAVLLCVKANDTKEAGTTVAPWVKETTVVLTLQNGLGNMDVLEGIFGKARVLGGVTSEGATVLDHGRIRHAGAGETFIGPPSDGAEKIVSVFRQAGFTSKIARDIHSLIWGKLIVNVGINALTALTTLKNGSLPKVGALRMTMEMAVNEAVAVAQARHVRLPYPDPLARVLDVCKATSDNVSSMLQDVLNERMTEIGYINGAIEREGKALGISTPVNFVLTRLVEAVQETYGERVRRRPNPCS